MWSVDDLVPYVKNARTHPPEQVDQIAASMERFGKSKGLQSGGHGLYQQPATRGQSLET